MVADAPIFLTIHCHRARMDSDVCNFERLQKIRQLSFQELRNVVADLSAGSRESPGRLGG